MLARARTVVGVFAHRTWIEFDATPCPVEGTVQRIGRDGRTRRLDGIARVQAGLRSSGFSDMIFGNFENRLANMHEELHQRLAL